MRNIVTRQISLFVIGLATTIYAQTTTAVVLPTLIGIGYLQTGDTTGLKYASMEGGAPITILGQNIASMSTMNRPYFEPKWISGAQLYGPELSPFDENKSQAMVGKLGYTVPPVTTLLSTSYDSFDGSFLPNGVWNHPLQFTLGVTNNEDNWGVSCANPANCLINYNRDYTAELYDVTPPNVFKNQLIQFHFNAKSSQRVECTPADQWPFREIKLGETLVDWSETMLQMDRLRNWDHDTIEAVVGEQTPDMDSVPKILFYNGFVHKLASSVHCNFAGDDCWTVRTHPKIDSLSQNQGFTTGGQILNIQGHGLNGTNISVMVDGVPCNVVENDTHHIKCETGIPVQPSLTGFQPGTPGLIRVKTDSTGAVNSTDLLTSLENFNLNGNMKEIWDSTQNHISGWFKAPTTGQYRFYISCDYGCSLSLDTTTPYLPGQPLSTQPTPTVIAQRTWGINWRQYMYYKSEGQKSNWIQFQAGNYYYLSALTANNKVSEHMTVSLEIIPDTQMLTTTPHPKISKTIQQISMDQNNIFEEWWITILTPDAGTYKINMLNPTVTPNSFWQSLEVSSSASAWSFQNTLSSYYWDNFRCSISVTKTMYDAASAITTQASLAASIEFRVKVLKVVRGFSANAISVTKVSTNSSITVVAPNKGGIPSTLPLNGTFALICYQNNIPFQSADMNYNTGPMWIQKSVGDSIPWLQGKIKVEYDYRYQYWENGLSFLVNFVGINSEVAPCQIVPGNGTYPLTGGDMYQNVTVLQNYGGSIMFEPVTLEFLYSDAQSPQVQIEINGIPALCPNLNCDFVYVNPASEITGQQLSTSGLLTLTGVNLPTTSILDISFGPVSCTGGSISTTQFTCQLSSPPVTGDWIAVVKTQLGLITNQITAPINIPTQVTSITPNVSLNYLGGDILTIQGDNFGFDTCCVIVTFGDGTTCQVISANMTSFTCMTNRFMNTTQSSTSISIIINNITNSNPLTVSLVGSVSQAIYLTPSSVSPVLKSEITIHLDSTQFINTLVKEDFRALLLSPTDLTLKKELFIMSADDSTKSLRIKFPGAHTGTYKIQLSCVQSGYLMSDTLVLDVHASVTSVSPLTGSTLGGTLITITGENFSNDHLDNPVKIGDDYCYVLSSSTTQITCRTDLLAGQTASDELVLVFLKTSEEAGTPLGQDIFFTYQSPSATITDFNVSFNAAVNSNVVTLTGTGLDSTTELQIDGINQQLVSSSGTQAVFSVINTKGLSSSDIQVFTSEGYPDGSQIAHSLTFKPALFGIYPTSGSSSGSWVQIHGSGFAQDISGLNIVVGTQNLCKQLNCIDFFTCNCLTNPLTLSSSSIYDFNINGIKQSSYVQSNVTYSQASMYTVTAVVLSEDTITFTGTNFPINAIAIAYFNGVQTNQTYIANSTFVIATFFDSGIPAGTGIPQLSFQVESNVAHFAPVTQIITQTITVNSSSSGIACSFAGGCNYNIQSSGLFATLLNPLNTVTFCGNKCFLIPDLSDGNFVSCALPPLATTYSVNSYQIKSSDILTGSVFPTGSTGAMLNDNVYTKDYIDTKTTGCNFGMTFKPSQVAVLDEAKVFINFITSKTPYVNNLQFQGSNDNWSTNTLLYTFDNNIHEGWNYINYRENNTKPAFNSYRFYGLVAGSCRVSEFKLIGVEAVADTNPSITCNPQINIAGVPLTSAVLNPVVYDSLHTPVIADISPRFGSVLGNTIVTIKGLNLLGLGSSTVLFDKRPCLVQSQTDIAIQCLTSDKPYVPDSPEAIVTIDGFGNAATQGFSYTYVSLWSDTQTWGGDLPPFEGESVAIPQGQHLLVDIENSPILFAIIVEGSLIFAPDNSNPNHLRTFDAHYIMIHCGNMEVGTERFPYTSKLIITMHSDRFSPYLPAFGNKVIAVRYGILDMHGIKRNVTWTRLAFTADVGATQITLLQPTDWKVGEEIAIATTSYVNTEHETRIITAVAQQGTVISFAEPLVFKHLSAVPTFGGVDMPMQGEVGLLTRNVVYRGDPEVSQRDMYGAQIMLHSPGDESAIGRIEYIELRDVGQAYKLGRYPIHFHCIGTVMKSYVKGNAIHQSYNRAVTTHAVHYFRVTENVAFDVMGHTFFVEDGVETNNYYDHNLAMNIKKSNSLLNTDQTPAGFWITNPNNIVINNAVAGTDAYGYWYDLEPHPTGGSFDINTCPQSTKLGEFRDNTAHSPHKYGLRIHHVLIPVTNACDSSPYDSNYLVAGKTDPYWRNPKVPAIFENFIAWKCGHNGAITERTGHVVFNNFKVADAGIAGIEFSVIEDIADGYAKVTGGMVIGNTGLNDADGFTNRTVWGFIGPRTENMTVDGLKFYNYDFQESAALGTCSHCFHPASTDVGGRTLTVKNLIFDATVPRRIKYQFPFREIIHDLDGSLTNLGPNTWATYYRIYNDQPECQNSTLYDGLICNSSVQIRRIAFYGYAPSSLTMMNIKVSKWEKDFEASITANDVTYQEYLQDINHTRFDSLMQRENPDPNMSWPLAIVTGHRYRFHWGENNDFTNMKYLISNRWLPTDLNIHMMTNFTDVRASINNTDQNGTLIANMTYVNKTESQLVNGDNVIYNQTAVRQFHFVINGKDQTLRRIINMQGIRCIINCTKTVATVTISNTTLLWSDPKAWPSGVIPVEGDAVEIVPGANIALDINTPMLKSLTINGRLTYLVNETNPLNLTIHTNWIYVYAGEFLIGNETHPYNGEASIILYGAPTDESLYMSNYVEAGNKVMAINGLVKFFGQTRDRISRLKATVFRGNTSAFVSSGLDWRAGDKIALLPTAVQKLHTDYRVIQSYDPITGNVTFTQPLEFYHWGQATSTAPDYNGVDMRGEVIMLSRNVRVIGNDSDSWGGQILVSDVQEIETSVWRTGKLTFNNVEVYNCSQRNTYKSAIRWENTQQGYSSVTNTSVWGSIGWSISMQTANNIFVDSSTFVGSRAIGLMVSNANNITMNNLIVAAVTKREELAMQNTVDKEACYSIGAYDMSEVTDIVLTNSVAAGCPYAGFIVQGHECGQEETQTNFKNNIAHSIDGSGALIYPDPKSNTHTTCYAGSYFSSYKCRQIGVGAHFGSQDIRFSKMTFIDNYLGPNIQTSGERIQTHTQLSNSIIYGEAGSDDCPKGQPDRVFDDKMAFMLFGSNHGGKPPHIVMPSQLPFYKIKSYGAWMAETNIFGVTFSGFSSNITRCGAAQRIFGVNHYSSDYIPIQRFKDITFNNVMQEAMISIYDPPEEWNNPSDCIGFPCTAPSNIVMLFENVKYGGSVQPQNRSLGFQIVSDTPGASDTLSSCDYQDQWNAWICANKYMGHLSFIGDDYDWEDRMVAPVYVTNEATGFTNKLNNQMDHTWDGFYTGQKHKSQFDSMIQTDQNYTVEYTGTPFKNMRYKLRGFYGQVKVKVPYWNAGAYAVYINGTLIPNTPWDKVQGRQSELTGRKGCGENRFVGVENFLEFILTPYCEISVKPLDSIYANVRMQWTMSEFYASGGTTSFADRVAGALGIEASQIKTVAVYTGSVVVNYYVTANDPASTVTTSSVNTAKNLAGLTTKLNTLITSDASSKVFGAKVISAETNTKPIIVDPNYKPTTNPTPTNDATQIQNQASTATKVTVVTTLQDQKTDSIVQMSETTKNSLIWIGVVVILLCSCCFGFGGLVICCMKSKSDAVKKLNSAPTALELAQIQNAVAEGDLNPQFHPDQNFEIDIFSKKRALNKANEEYFTEAPLQEVSTLQDYSSKKLMTNATDPQLTVNRE